MTENQLSPKALNALRVCVAANSAMTELTEQVLRIGRLPSEQKATEAVELIDNLFDVAYGAPLHDPRREEGVEELRALLPEKKPRAIALSLEDLQEIFDLLGGDAA